MCMDLYAGDMDLETYYAEQEARMDLPQETPEEYQKRMATLQRRRSGRGSSLLATATFPRPATHQRSPYDKTGTPGHTENIMKRKLAEDASEAAVKRQRVIDQEEIEGQLQATSDPLFLMNHTDGDPRAPVQIHEMSPNMLIIPQLPSASPQLEQHQERSSINTLATRTQHSSTKDCNKASHERKPQGECDVPVPRSEEATSSKLHPTTIQNAHSHSSDDIDSFSGDIELVGSKPICAAKVADAAAEDSPIGSFSRTQGVASSRQRPVAVKRQATALVLRPVGETAQSLGKKSAEPPTSPIEEISFLTTPEKILQTKLLEAGPSNSTNNVLAKDIVKPRDRAVKLLPKHALIAEKDDDHSVIEGPTVRATSSPPSRAKSPINASSRMDEKARKQTANLKTVKRKIQKKKEKPQLVTPADYARKLQPNAAAAGDNAEGQAVQPRRKNSTVKFLEGKHIFYTGGDMRYASETTRGRMNIIVKFGGHLMPEFDPQVTTHVITEAQVLATLRALGLRNLDDIPDHIPTVRWSWVLSVLGKETFLSKDEVEKKLKDAWLHAAFAKRIDAGCQPTKLVSLKGKEKSRISNEDQKIKQDRERPAVGLSEIQRLLEGDQSLTTPHFPHEHIMDHTIQGSRVPTNEGDPLAPFYHDTKMERGKDDGWSSLGDLEHGESNSGSDIEDVSSVKPVKRGWTCDQKDQQSSRDCPNQDIIDKLTELMEIHKTKLGDEDRWRAFSYTKCIRGLRHYPKRIKTLEEARNIRGVGEKTARKIEEIIQTGDLRRIKYEKTEDVAVTRLFQGIYGVGQSTAFQWYVAGCRTLKDLEEGKGDVKLSTSQRIGLQYYDDITSRMPREEAKAIFDHIQRIAYSIDPKLFVEIMGSYRRGKSTCGDIDIMITRPTEDGKTHMGVLSRLLQELREAKIITEDLALPDDPDDLEAVYRGLCCLPGVPNAKRRRIDFLSVPWTSRGAALIYYTGDDIFNRAMRFKAGAMGYSLNQKGLFGNVVRDPRNRRIKFNEGVLVASETEEEIFKILEVPWQEPHERVRG